MNGYTERFSIKDIGEDFGYLYKLYIDENQIKYIHEIGKIYKNSVNVVNTYDVMYYKKTAFIPIDIIFN